MEHGFAGSGADAMPVGHGRDRRTGLPVFSLFGDEREPGNEILGGLDAIVYDAQDVGARFYTFITTLFYVLRAAGRRGLPVLVLDRPNPIGGETVEGPIAEDAHLSWYAAAAIPIRHGMTAGELAQLFDDEHHLGANLTVVALDGWRRSMWHDQTGLPWVGTSSAVPHLSTATVYPGACLLEGVNVSAGRGTGLPFEQFGAAWIDPEVLCDALNDRELPGVHFRPTSFEPAQRYDPRWDGGRSELCFGAQIHVTDRDALAPVRMGLHLVAALRRLSPGRCEWQPHFDVLMGSSTPRERLDAGEDAEQVSRDWEEDEAGFRYRRREYLLYD
jgi:beta-N-acetylhexosaminidase